MAALGRLLTVRFDLKNAAKQTFYTRPHRGFKVVLLSTLTASIEAISNGRELARSFNSLDRPPQPGPYHGN